MLSSCLRGQSTPSTRRGACDCVVVERRAKPRRAVPSFRFLIVCHGQCLEASIPSLEPSSPHPSERNPHLPLSCFISTKLGGPGELTFSIFVLGFASKGALHIITIISVLLASLDSGNQGSTPPEHRKHNRHIRNFLFFFFFFAEVQIEGSPTSFVLPERCPSSVI